MSGDYRPELVIGGLGMPEAPRWHDGKLWFVDHPMKQVLTVGPDGKTTLFADVPTRPMGIGFLPGGVVIVVSMEDARLLRYEAGEAGTVTEYADLSAVTVGLLNDLVVDGRGWAYASNTGRRTDPDAERAPANIGLFIEGQAPRVVASGLRLSNGLVVTPDGSTLIVAETLGARLTAFTIAGDGSLTGQRVFADLEGEVPNGISLDAEGAVWVSSHQGRYLRVMEGGKITDTVDVPGGTHRMAIACMLGGEDGRQLFLVSVDALPRTEEMLGTGRVDVVTVEVPGAGWP
jgi:sugar lactone lactonase YvrE